MIAHNTPPQMQNRMVRNSPYLEACLQQKLVPEDGISAGTSLVKVLGRYDKGIGSDAEEEKERMA
jgi:hypothetical protein